MVKRKRKPELGLTKSNPLDDARVLLSVTTDDIKAQCEKIGVDYNSLDIENVFHLHRKYMEGDYVMGIYWQTLEDAILESDKEE